MSSYPQAPQSFERNFSPQRGGSKLAIGAAVFAAAIFGSSLAASANENVRFALNWLVSGKNAGYFVAVDQGFYEEEGLNVTISRGNGSGDTIKRIAVGESDFGLADTASVIGAIANDSSPVKVVGMMFGRSSVAVIYTEGVGIESPQDLAGRKIARSASGASVAMFPGFLNANDIDRETFEEVVTAASSFVPLLLSREVEAVVDQSSYLGRYNKSGANAGLSFEAFRFADYGLNLYGDAIVVSQRMIEERPETIRKFMRATLRGNQYAFENPEEAIEILRKSNPEIEADVGLEELLDTREIALTEEVETHGYGYVGDEQMADTISIVDEYVGLNRPIEPGEVFTLDFIELN